MANRANNITIEKRSIKTLLECVNLELHFVSESSNSTAVYLFSMGIVTDLQAE